MGDLAGEAGGDAEQGADPGGRVGRGGDPPAALDPQPVEAEQQRDRADRDQDRVRRDRGGEPPAERRRRAIAPGSMIARMRPSQVLRKAATPTTSCAIRIGSRIAAPRTGSIAERHQRHAERAHARKAALGEADQQDGRDGEQIEGRVRAASPPAVSVDRAPAPAAATSRWTISKRDEIGAAGDDEDRRVAADPLEHLAGIEGEDHAADRADRAADADHRSRPRCAGRGRRGGCRDWPRRPGARRWRRRSPAPRPTGCRSIWREEDRRHREGADAASSSCARN